MSDTPKLPEDFMQSLRYMLDDTIERKVTPKFAAQTREFALEHDTIARQHAVSQKTLKGFGKQLAELCQEINNLGRETSSDITKLSGEFRELRSVVSSQSMRLIEINSKVDALRYGIRGQGVQTQRLGILLEDLEHSLAAINEYDQGGHHD